MVENSSADHVASVLLDFKPWGLRPLLTSDRPAVNQEHNPQNKENYRCPQILKEYTGEERSGEENDPAHQRRRLSAPHGFRAGSLCFKLHS